MEKKLSPVYYLTDKGRKYLEEYKDNINLIEVKNEEAHDFV